jgi:EmrB/QacA subfamily drug resistance transporter
MSRETDVPPEVARGPAAEPNISESDTNPWFVLAIVVSATFMQLVDVSIVNVAIPSIRSDLAATYGAVQLVLVLYQLTFAGALITAARLGDLYGRKRLFLMGMVLFTLASAACGAAPNATSLVLARALQGLGSGLMFPQVLSVIQVTFPPRRRGSAFAAVGATIGIATILGPLLGGALIAWNPAGLDWRTIFYVNVPIGILAVIAAVKALPESKAPGSTRLDIPGALTVTAALLLLVYPLAEGRTYGWPVWSFILLGLSVPLFAVFVGRELRLTRERRDPLVLMTLFHDRAFRVGSLLACVFFAAVPPFFFAFSIYIQIGLGFSALGSGLTSFPFAVGSGFASAMSDRLARRLGNRVLLIGSAVLVLGMVAMLLTVRAVGTQPHAWQFIPAMVISGVGLGLFVAPVFNIILAGIHSEGAGSASGVLSTVQQVGGAIGVALIGIVLFGLVTANAGESAQTVAPALRQELTTAGLPGTAADQIVRGFQTCFRDRAAAADPSANPPSCQRLITQAAQSPLPAPVKSEVRRAIEQRAAPAALAHDFSRSFEWTLLYEIGVFVLSMLLVFRLPPVDPHQMGRPQAAA